MDEELDETAKQGSNLDKWQLTLFPKAASAKKYSSVAEVTKLLNIKIYQLRYLESTLPRLTIRKIRNRRYYTNDDIEYLRHYLPKNGSNEILLNDTETTDRIQKIDQLIGKFNTLSLKIRKLVIPNPFLND